MPDISIFGQELAGQCPPDTAITKSNCSRAYWESRTVLVALSRARSTRYAVVKRCRGSQSQPGGRNKGAQSLCNQRRAQDSRGCGQRTSAKSTAWSCMRRLSALPERHNSRVVTQNLATHPQFCGCAQWGHVIRQHLIRGLAFTLPGLLKEIGATCPCATQSFVRTI